MSKTFLETIKIIDGKALHLEYHQERLNKALDSSNSYSLKDLINTPLKGLYKCRIVYDSDNLEIEYTPYVKQTTRSLKLVYTKTINYKKKYTNRDEINNLFLCKEHCDDILIIKNGFVSDTSIANIAFFDGEKWYTPDTPLLEGTCRARLLHEGKLIEREILEKDIKKYKRVALMNAMVDFDIIVSDNIEEIIC